MPHNYQLKQKRSKRRWQRENYLIKKAHRQLKQRIRHKLWKKGVRKNKLNIHLHRRRKGYLRARKPHKYEKLQAPSNFSLINNAEGTLEYFDKSRKLLSAGTQICFDVSKIDSLTPDAIALLIASIKDDRFTRGLNVIGNEPANPVLKEVFTESGFYEYVATAYRKERKNKNNVLLHKETDIKVENDIAKEVCEIAVKHTFGNSKKFPPIYEILIELMANTNNHANLNNPHKYNWWLFLYTNPKTKVSSFSFLDLGVGIFESLPVKNYLNKILTKLTILSNTDLIDKLFSGEISSRTLEKDRGKGMPLIFNHSQNHFIKQFVLISNDVYTNITSGYKEKLKHTLSGTLLYWELHPNANQNGRN